MNWKIPGYRRTPSGNKVTPPNAYLTEADILPRRIVLRGALAAGCGLLVPAALLGCDSRKETGSAGSAPSASGPESTGPAPDMESAAPAAPAKSSQASVQYQTQPKGGQKCGNCMNFIAESNTCKRVDGTVSPQGWCIIWANAA